MVMESEEASWKLYLHSCPSSLTGRDYQPTPALFLPARYCGTCGTYLLLPTQGLAIQQYSVAAECALQSVLLCPPEIGLHTG